MAPVGSEILAIFGERVQNLPGLGSPDAPQNRLRIAKTRPPAVSGSVHFRSTSHGFARWDCRSAAWMGSHAFLAVDGVSRHIENRLAREFANGPAVPGGKRLRGAFRSGAAMPGLPAGQHDAGRHALEVPLEGSADGLVEIVQIEDQFAVRGGERPQVLHVRISTQLSQQAGVGQPPEVRRHDGRGAAEERERRRFHALVADRQQLCDPAFLGFPQHVRRIEPPVFGV